MMTITAKVEDCGLCWAGAFPNVTDCEDTRMQMRRLDRVREGMLSKVWRKIADTTSAPPSSGGPGTVRRRYKGRPFSYYGFLEKAARPTNMAYRKKIQKILLPYSEL